MSTRSTNSQLSMSPTRDRFSFGSLSFGDPNAELYDTRENRTKTAVTAIFQGTSTTTLLRSYDSRKEPAPDFKCRIWEAGRATCATAMAFKPVRIGQSWYLDGGDGKYNPAPMILDEAVKNEWPGRDVGVFVSVGTGKRPPGPSSQKHEWWEGVVGGSMGEFAEARRRLVSKLEGCEDTHQYMLQDHLSRRGVNAENYYRLNVEIGVGEFGMNEWARLSDISTHTRTYLARREVEAMNQGAAAKMAKIHFAKIRHERAEVRKESGAIDQDGGRYSWQDPLDRPLPHAPPANPMAVELPGDDMYYQTEGFRPGAQQYEHRPSIADQKYVVVSNDGHAPRQYDSTNPRTPPQRPVQPAAPGGSPYQSPNSLHQHPSQYRPNPQSNQSHHGSFGSMPSPRASYDFQPRTSPPPLPPKTPIGDLPYPDQANVSAQSPQGGNGPRTFMNMGDLGRRLPYPDVDGPPPAVNTANKPQISR